MGKAETEALFLLEDLGLDYVPVALEEVCNKMSTHDFIVTLQEEKMTSKDFHGITLGNSNGAAILVNSNIKNRHRRRFTAAHEIGHVHLHVQTKIQSDFHCSAKDISSSDNINDLLEREANEFASSLLMPKPIIENQIHRNDLSWTLIEKIRKQCDVSLEAAVRRVIKLSKEPCCLIVHKQGEMWTPIKSNFFNIYLPSQEFPSNLDSGLDDGTRLYSEELDQCDFIDWQFPESASVGQLLYSSIYNDEFDRRMTLLLLNEDAENEIEDEEDLPHF